MKRTILILSFIGAMSIDVVNAQMKGDSYHLPSVNITAEKNRAVSNKNNPLKYAVSTLVDDIYHTKGSSQSGQWTQMFDGSWEYNLRLSSKNATSLNVGMQDFFLPPSAQLWVSSDDQSIMRGPYDGSYNQKHGFFWLGDIPTDHMNVRITVSDEEKQYLSFKVSNVSRGFYRYWIDPSYLSDGLANKSGSCNVDVACPEGNDWESQINSVGRYSFTHPVLGGLLCSGQLINNTAQDGVPLFSSADHCGYSDLDTGIQFSLSEKQNVAASIALIWNYQSLTCRAPGSSQSGVQISTNGFNNRQSGATYLASNNTSDFALVRLNTTPNQNFGLEYTGWDRRDIAPDSAVAIHHPSGHAKRISFENDALSITDYLSTSRGSGTHLRVADWDLGTTEIGSSGSGLWNSDQLFVGQLEGGAAACGNDAADWYGRLYISWDNGSDAQSRMRDWLDPIDTGQQTLQGTGGCEAPTVSIVNNSTNSVGELLTFSSEISGGAGGYTYEWDVNADGGIDGINAEVQARFNQEFVGNINLRVTDSTGCVGTTSQAIVVASPVIQLQQVVNIQENLNQVCGNNDVVVDPGERWSSLLIAENVGSITASDTYLALGKNRTSANGQSDSFGNSVSTCGRQFIDITSTGTLHQWEVASNVTNADANDEGSVLIQLSQAFDHYGQSIDQVRVSTNGFISTSADSTGGDWDNDCPLPESPNRDDIGARIAPLHDDFRGADDTVNSINTSDAVCVFNRDNQPANEGADFVMLESPVISLGDMITNEDQSRSMFFAVAEDATCGSSFSINHEASVFDEGFNAGQNNVLTQTIGNNGQCNVVTTCDVGTTNEVTNDITPRRGLWWNPDRNGNGLDLYTIGSDQLVYFFYTGDTSGEPVWYLANDADSSYNQYYNNIARFKVPGGFENGDLGADTVGWSNTSFIDDSTAIQVRMIDGRLSAEKQYFFQFAANETPNMHTGSYFTPSENGWGHSIGTLGNSRVVINYIYDQAGNPYWTIASGANDNSVLGAVYVNTFCPSCPAVTTQVRSVGEVKLTLDGQTNGTLDFYNVTDEGVSWNKNNLPIVNIIPPNN